MAQNIVYHPGYNVSFFGLEKLHKFPVDKFSRICKTILKNGFGKTRFLSPIFEEQLIFKHLTDAYKQKCSSTKWLSTCIDLDFVKFFPYRLVKKYLCNPLLFASCGTVAAAFSAFENKKSVNVGGGYHHAWFDGGEGSCVYPDIPIAMQELREKKNIKRIASIDLDAHQGNGTARAFPNHEDTFLVDIYNDIPFPSDLDAKKYTSVDIPIKGKSSDEEYLGLIADKAFPAIEEFAPEFLFFNAGTDIYKKDPLTQIEISAEGILKRDKMVFEFAEKINVPIIMTLSGGYHKDSATIVAESIIENFK
ncbi:histone deacetylase [Candidatus Uabimicrobium sp. HlEnr_7]|uniref:histone deacetylase family protein n=1 Tax=Candidatus Uabimicrobium helgolandensis TaxID=3095367 RepID=UPI0035562411